MSRTRLNDDFARQVLSVVEEIPAGSVATYGQLACMIGRPKNARLVARVLSHAEYYGHRSAAVALAARRLKKTAEKVRVRERSAFGARTFFSTLKGRSA